MHSTDVLLDGLAFPEGPRWHEDRLFFSDMHAHRVVAVDAGGNDETIVEVPNQPSGLGWLPGGDLLVVSMVDRKVLRLAGGTLAVHADLADLAPANCNDMVVDARGRAYVGNFGFDMYAGEPWRKTNIIAVDPDGNAWVAADEMSFPNGPVITPDGRTLIVGESSAARLTAFDIADDGSLSNRRVWASLREIGATPDGICLDADGRDLGCLPGQQPVRPRRRRRRAARRGRDRPRHLCVRARRRRRPHPVHLHR